MTDHLTAATKILCQEGDALHTLATSLAHDPQPLTQCVDTILGISGKVVVTGIGKSGLVGAKITATLASTGTPAQFMHTADAGHGDLGMVSPGDLILALSNSGQSRELLPILAFARKMNTPLIAMTAGLDSPLARAAQIVLSLPKLDEACPLGLAPMTSTTMQLALGDAIAGALIEARGFTRGDFAVRHLGGSLGLRTKSIDDYYAELTSPDPIPMVEPDTGLGGIVRAISQGRKGATLVRPGSSIVPGIITEGDISRAIGTGNMDARASQMMTANPIYVRGDQSLVEAITLMRTRKINVLLVLLTDQDSPDSASSYQLLHLHDLLGLGL